MIELENLPKGWKLERLADITIKLTDGSHNPPAKQEIGLPMLSAKNIESGWINWNASYRLISDVDFDAENLRTRVEPGDVLLTIVGTIGRAAIIPNGCKKFTLQRSVAAIRVPFIDPKFVLYQFFTQRVQEYLNDNAKGTAQKGIYLKSLGDLQIQIPPLDEQARVVEKLEELLSDLDNGVAELKAAQTKLTQYRQSLLKSAVEGSLTAEWRQQNPVTETGEQLLQRILIERRQRWEQQKLAEFKEKGKTPPKDWQKKYPEPVQPDTSELPELPGGWVWASVAQVSADELYSLAIGPFGSNLKVSDYTNHGVPLVFVRNIRSGNYGGDFTKFVSEEKASELNAHSVSVGDVLITKMGEPPGDADVFPDNQPDSIITADCIKVRCWPGLIIPEFLKSAINSWIGKQQILPITKGVAQKKVSLGRFASLAIPIAPFDEQEEIINRVLKRQDEVTRELQAALLGIKQAEAQRKNILKAAFSGQLVPQDPNDEPASALLEKIKAERAIQNKQQPTRRKKKAALA